MDKMLSKKISIEITINVIIKNIYKMIKHITLAEFIDAIIFALDDLECPHKFFPYMSWEQFSSELTQLLPKILFDDKYEDFIDIIRLEETHMI